MVKKKILVLANIDSGLYHFRKELLQRLVTDGHDVYCSLPFGEKTDLIKEIGCECIDTKVSRRGTKPLEDIRLLFFYIKMICKIKPDVVLTYTIKPNVYGGMACQITRTPYICNITGLGTAIENGGMLQKLTLTLYKMGLRKATKVFFQNNDNRSFMTKKRIVKGENELLPGSGVNLTQHCLEKYPDNDDKIILLTIGRIMRDKGINEILQAAEIIKPKHPEVVFRLIGSYDECFEQQVEKAVNDGIVEHLDHQPQVKSFISESHATLHASYHEGMSNVLLETAACGRPVISTNVPGCKETYDDGVSGIAFEPRDVDSMVKAIEKFLSLSHEEKEQMGKAGRIKIEKEFNRDIIIEKYIKTIERI